MKISTILFSTFLAGIVAAASVQAGTQVVFETTKGNFTVELEDEKAPITTANFLQYVDEGHFDGVIFHRVIEDFMVQTGGFELKEDGVIEQKKSNEKIKNEANNGLKNERGTLAMARTGDPHSASNQFFINHGDENGFLDHVSESPSGWGYAVFGKVVEGMDVVDAIAAVETGVKTMNARAGDQVMARPMKDVPVENILIKSAKRKKVESE